MSTNTGIVLVLVIGAGLAGCGSGSSSASDGAAAGPEAAAPADASYASEAGASIDGPIAAVEAGREEAALPADASVDVPATPLDGRSAADSPASTPDAVSAEEVAQMDAAESLGVPDAAGLEAAKPADATVADTAKPATDVAPATLGEMSAQQLHAALANKDFLLIDVHYPNAGSVPQTDARIAFDDIPALVAFIGPDLNRKVVLTCYSGHMSKEAGDTLVARGYRNIGELTGGTNAWTAAGYSLVRLDGGL